MQLCEQNIRNDIQLFKRFTLPFMISHECRLHQMYLLYFYPAFKISANIFSQLNWYDGDNSFCTRSFTLCRLKGFYFCDALNRAINPFLQSDPKTSAKNRILFEVKVAQWSYTQSIEPYKHVYNT